MAASGVATQSRRQEAVGIGVQELGGSGSFFDPEPSCIPNRRLSWYPSVHLVFCLLQYWPGDWVDKGHSGICDKPALKSNGSRHRV